MSQWMDPTPVYTWALTQLSGSNLKNMYGRNLVGKYVVLCQQKLEGDSRGGISLKYLNYLPETKHYKYNIYYIV